MRVGPAQAVYASMLAEGVIVRPIAGYGMPEHLRITIGTEAEVKAVRDSLQRFVAAGK